MLKNILHSIHWKYILARNKLKCISMRHKLNLQKINTSFKSHPQIIVSVTSYSKRFKTLDICLKSLLCQTVKPNKIILYLYKKEKVPAKVKELQRFGLQIKYVNYDIKPHKKYYYAMKEYPNDIVITVDDDVVYSKDLISELLKTYSHFPNCVVAARARNITFDTHNNFVSYRKWKMVQQANVPSYNFLATGVGGVLYPPHLLKLDILLDLNKIKKYLTVDDLWLKNVELLSNVKTVLCDGKVDKKRYEILSVQQYGLSQNNLEKNENDFYIKKLDETYNMKEKMLSRTKQNNLINYEN